MSGVGVLAVLDDLIADMGDTPGTTGHQVAQVRDAVAEMIEMAEMANDYLNRNGIQLSEGGSGRTLGAALARCGDIT